MSRIHRRSTRATILMGVALSTITFAFPLVMVPSGPAMAQRVSVSVEFRSALEPYGAWHRHRRWGDIWVPARVARDWRPYTVGHWVYSDDYGWYWVPEQDEAAWGLIVYHYGRWVDDDEYGWVWVPGREWGPGWVSWRRGDAHVGWAPLPPDEVIVEYRDRPDYWVFVRTRDLVAPNIVKVILPLRRREVYIRDTVIVNRTVVIEDRRFAVNPGIPPAYVAAAHGRPIPTYRVRPHVLAGTTRMEGAVELRAGVLRDRRRAREIVRQTISRAGAQAIQPARDVPPPQALGENERGRLGERPPRAAQGAAEGKQDAQRPGDRDRPGQAGMKDTEDRKPGTTGTGDRRGDKQNATADKKQDEGRQKGARSDDADRKNARDRRGDKQDATSDKKQNEDRRKGARSDDSQRKDVRDRKGAADRTEGAGGGDRSDRGRNSRGGDKDRRGDSGDNARRRDAKPETSGQGSSDRGRSERAAPNRLRQDGSAPSGASRGRKPETSGSGARGAAEPLRRPDAGSAGRRPSAGPSPGDRSRRPAPAPRPGGPAAAQQAPRAPQTPAAAAPRRPSSPSRAPAAEAPRAPGGASTSGAGPGAGRRGGAPELPSGPPAVRREGR